MLHAVLSMKQFSAHVRRALTIALVFSFVMVGTAATVMAQQPSGVVIQVAPIYLYPDATRTPLRTATINMSVRIVEDAGEWLKIEFHDPVFGRRQGYVLAKHVRVSPEPEPMDAPVPAIVSARATTGLDDLSTLKNRTRLSFYDPLWRERKVSFKGVTPDGVEVWTGRNSFETIPSSMIHSVERKRNFAGMGASIGAGVGGLLTALGYKNCMDRYDDVAHCTTGSFVIMGVSAGIGAAAGAAARSSSTLFLAPSAPVTAAGLSVSPLVTPHGAGARLAWRF